MNLAVDDTMVDARIAAALAADKPLLAFQATLTRLTEQWERDTARMKEQRATLDLQRRDAIARQAEARAEIKKLTARMEALRDEISTTPKPLRTVRRNLADRTKLVEIMAREHVRRQTVRQLVKQLKL